MLYADKKHTFLDETKIQNFHDESKYPQILQQKMIESIE